MERPGGGETGAGGMAGDGARGLDEMEQDRDRHDRGDDDDRPAVEHGALTEAVKHVERLLRVRPFR